jgi:hypothetical protein
LLTYRVALATPTYPFLLLLIGLVPKHNGGWCWIYDLSYPPLRSVNDWIFFESTAILYTYLDNILPYIIAAGQSCIFIKYDIKDAFCNISIALANCWLLGFEWEGLYYTEAVLLFSLVTALFLFNLFTEALY